MFCLSMLHVDVVRRIRKNSREIHRRTGEGNNNWRHSTSRSEIWKSQPSAVSFFLLLRLISYYFNNYINFLNMPHKLIIIGRCCHDQHPASFILYFGHILYWPEASVSTFVVFFYLQYRLFDAISQLCIDCYKTWHTNCCKMYLLSS